MKKYRTMIIFTSIFVVLFALYFVMSQINNSKAEDELEETIMVTEISKLASMEYTDGETTMSFTNGVEAWKVTNNDEINLDNDSVEAIADTLSQIESVRVLNGADELSSYGLDDAAYTITLIAESGSEITLYIGNEIDGNYYATIGDKAVVYVIDSSAVDALVFDITTLEAQETDDVETEQ